MKSIKKILALLLAFAMCLTLLAACSSNPSSDDTPADNNGAEDNTPANEAEEPVDDDAEPADQADSDLSDIEGASIIVYMLDETGAGDKEAINAALNELAQEKLGISVEITYLDFGSYSNQLSLSITGGETVDLAAITPVPGSTYASITANGQAMPLNDLLDEYGQGILEEAGPYLDATSISGNIYAIPVMRQKTSSLTICWPTETAQSLGIEDQLLSMTSWSDVTEMANWIKENTDLYPFGGQTTIAGFTKFIWGDGSFDAIRAYDNLGDTQNLVYLGDDGKAQLLIDNADNVAMMKMFADWNAQDMIWPDTVTNADIPSSQLMNITTFFDIIPSEFGGENTKVAQTGFPTTLYTIAPGMLMTSDFTSMASFIPVTAKEPEAAMAFMNLLYTDPEVATTFCWGVEGVNYEIKDTGEAGYIGDATAMDCGWHLSDFWFGNTFIVTPWEGDGADFRELARENLESSPKSEALGFSLDTSGMNDYVGALTAVTSQYYASLVSGLYTEQLENEYRDALAAADVDGYLAEINNQLEAWRANN